MSKFSDYIDILEFIERRFKKDCDWLDGNCYYFAIILKERFPNLNIFYMPIRGHFVVSDGDHFYDFTGTVDMDEDPLSLDYLENEDPIWYSRLMADCRD